MINKQVKSSLVTGFPELADLLASDGMIHSCHQYSPSALPISPDISKASKGECEGVMDPVVVYRDSPFHFVPASRT